MKNSKQGFIPIVLSKLGFLSFIFPLPPSSWLAENDPKYYLKAKK